MSDEPSNGDAGNRATVAMVLRTVESLHDLTDANFKTVGVQLAGLEKALDGITPRVEKIEAAQHAMGIEFMSLRDGFAEHRRNFERHKADADKRIADATERGKFWRRSAPTLLIAIAASLPGWYALLFT